MNTFGNKLKSLRTKNDMTQDDLAKNINTKYTRKISKSMLSKWENDKENPTNFQDVIALADYFHVTSDYLLGLTEISNERFTSYSKVPILGSIAAGQPMLAQEDIVGYESISKDEKIDYCLKVKGDSMIGARIFNGDTVFVRRQPDIENGEIGVVIIDGEEATLKRVFKVNGTVILHPENPRYNDIVFSKRDFKEVMVLGKVISVKFNI